SACGRRQARVPRSRALPGQDQRLDPRCGEFPSTRFLHCERYLLLEADPICNNRLRRQPESTAVRAPGYRREASLLRRSFEESSRARAHFLSWVLVTILQLRVAGF